MAGPLTIDAQAMRAQTDQRPPVAPFVTTDIQATIAEVDVELREICPQVEILADGHARVPSIIDAPPSPWLTRVRWLLKRRQHLMGGHDYDIMIIDSPRRRGHVLMVSHTGRTLDPAHSTIPPKVTAMASREHSGAPTPLQVSLQLGVSLEAVERAMEGCPASEDPVAWCRARIH